MEEPRKHPDVLTAKTASQLADVMISAPQFDAISPRWVTRCLEWKGLKTGIFRLNKVEEGESLLDVLCSQKDSDLVPESFMNYEEHPREYVLNSISTVMKVDTRVSDLFCSPYDQVQEQLRLCMESLKERQEGQLINNPNYGLLKTAPDAQRMRTRKGYPTPDDLDDLLAKVWKEPSFFLAHPLAIAAFGRECTRRGVPPATVSLHGATFLAWRGIPLLPSNKLMVDGHRRPQTAAGKTNILLIRTGEQKQGVIGLYQAGLTGERSRGLSVKYMGIDEKGYASYLLSIYCSAAMLSGDAVAVLEDVEVGHYYDYQ